VETGAFPLQRGKEMKCPIKLDYKFIYCNQCGNKEEVVSDSSNEICFKCFIRNKYGEDICTETFRNNL